ncbi:Hypothetical predicted protein [Mytilus galloprovincialis]|uniref:Uncharacterized protein n=1 Tax=Mytilus galloprovincialis TaxID=29158 RepID=A0A8B6C5B4_MYTGA|nr:Hypothetical predicted protein [Mytilus galloprovincialis]
MTHILEKTQTDVYLDFIGENPSIKIAQRMFERCKPYFVRPVRPKDRQTCCCKYHVEFKTVFKSCMEFRKKLLIENEPNECYSTPVYDSISDVVNATLCEKVDGSHNLQCLKRNCSDCGVKILNFLPCELDVSDTAEFVKWEKFENVNVNVKGNKTIKKLMLVKKESQVGELFSYFRKLIETFPVHQHRATWQNEQFQNLVRNLPEKQCVCVHDFSENYRCSELTEIQSAYFQKTEVSVHVTILHRHALLEYDGVDSSEDFPEIITEQFFVISPDLVHDQYFVHQVRKLYSGIFTVDFIFRPQDAAGGIIKRQADCAILRGQTQIRTAKDLYEYANSFLTQPRSHCKRRIFRYAETIHRDNRLSFKPVPSIRSLHQVRASRDSAKGLINISELSCFCVNCCHHMYDQCSNSIKTGGYTEWEMKREYRADAQENEENEQVSLQELVSVGQLVALYTDDDEEEYYMLKVEKSMETLRIDTTDSWGSLLPAGTPVFCGLYYNKTNSPFQYRLVNRKAVSGLYLFGSNRKQCHSNHRRNTFKCFRMY